jgi:hypothetical protein
MSGADKGNLGPVNSDKSMNRDSFVVSLFAILLLFSGSARAASVIPPKENIHYIAEHLAEAAQDARYFALPWTMSAKQDEWRPVVAIAGTEFRSELADARGGLLTVGFERGWNATTSYSLLAFYDRFNVYGGSSENVLTAGPIRNVPLDIPENAIFSNPQGHFIHSGLGLVVRRDKHASSENGWALVGGVLLEHLALSDYRYRYRLTSGADAGVEGVYEYGGSSNFINPFFGGQYRYRLGSRFSLLPRMAVGIPLPPGDITTRMTGPGFDLTAESTGAQNIHIGDGYLILGMGLHDRAMHLEYDLGSIVTFPLIERLTHQGVDNGVMFSVTWRGAKR